MMRRMTEDRAYVPSLCTCIPYPPPPNRREKMQVHVGSYPGVLRYQLGLKTPPPPPRENAPGGVCALEVTIPSASNHRGFGPSHPITGESRLPEEKVTLTFEDGKDFVFDDNRAHRSINTTPYPRLILVRAVGHSGVSQYRFGR